MHILEKLAEYTVVALVALGLVTAPVIAPTPDDVSPQESPTLVSDTTVADEEDSEPEAIVGAALPQQDALIDTYLASNITNSATTMTLADGTLRDGTTLSGYYCFTIDINTPTLEYVCGTASSTSVTGLLRGVKVSNPNATSSSLAFAHRRFATVQVTDFPFNQLVQRVLNGTDPLSAPIYYDTGIGPVNGADLADKEYVLSAITGTSTISYNRVVVSGTAGETVATGTVVYLRQALGKWYKVDTDDLSTYQDRQLGISQGPAATDAAIPGGVLTYGLDSTQTGLAPAGFLQRYLWASDTAGATSTATTTQVLGSPISNTTFFFNPDMIDSTVYTPTTFTATSSFTGPVVITGTTTLNGFSLGTGSSSVIVYGTGSSTYEKPANLKHIVIEMVGGGGGGAGADTDNAGEVAGGGSGGGYCKKLIPASLLSSSTVVFVGSAGGGGNTASSPSAGTAGGTSRFIGFATTTGGSGNDRSSTPASAGTSTGCDVNLNGGIGSTLTSVSGSAAWAGRGGDSIMGFGGVPKDSDNGVGPSGYGSGGYGGQDSSAVGSSNGANGVLIITQHF